MNKAARSAELFFWTAVAAMSPTAGALPYRPNRDGGPMMPATPEEWADFVVVRGKALRDAVRRVVLE